MKLPIKGVIPPLVTPLLENMQLDVTGLRKLIEHVLNGGVHGIFLLGTNGEGPSFDIDFKKKLITEACEIINNRVPVLVSISDTSIESTLEIAEFSKKKGADVLVLTSPYYFPISEQEMVNYLEEVAPLLPLPFMLYNIPSCTKHNLSLHTISRGLELGAIGIKESSGDLVFLKELIDTFKNNSDFSIIAGSEALLFDAINYGGHGVVAGGANFFPRLFVTLYEASLLQDLKKVEKLHNEVLLLQSTFYSIGNSDTKSIKAIKCALSIMGICTDHMALPLKRFTESQKKEVQQYLRQFEYSKDFIPN